ncbi:MAG: hypothetical protein E7568_00110 [Ruminococcaceae bacterium]|nr:hypothetical protein [Oscillospiraceae bacterium]
MSKEIKDSVLEDDNAEIIADYIGIEREKKPIPKWLKKSLIISGIVAGSLAVLITVLNVVSYDWRNGNKPLPSFIADIGLFQSADFRYFDGITVNGVDIGGLSEKKAAKVINKSQNSKRNEYTLSFKSGNKSYTLEGKDIVFDVDSTSALKEAKKYCVSVMRGEAIKHNKSFNANIKVDKKAMSTTFELMKQQLHCDPVDATFEGMDANGLVFVNHIDGIDVDEDSLSKDIETFLSRNQTSGQIIVTPAKTTPAKIKVESLKEKIQLIGTHSTTAGNVTNSNKNMKKAMEMCNGSVIAPGEIWSFNACTGDSNKPENGWVASTVIMGGEYVQGYGGGICQASTTIYNAALYANMKIVSRYNHAYPSSYAKVGLDATIDYPGKDLKLQNTSEYPIYMHCVMEGKKLTVNIYGCPDTSYEKITLTSYTTERVEGSHYIVAAQRHFWKDGKIFKTESLHSSRYKIKVDKEETTTPTPTPAPTPTPTPEPDEPDTPDNPNEDGNEEEGGENNDSQNPPDSLF